MTWILRTNDKDETQKRAYHKWLAIFNVHMVAFRLLETCFSNQRTLQHIRHYLYVFVMTAVKFIVRHQIFAFLLWIPNPGPTPTYRRSCGEAVPCRTFAFKLCCWPSLLGHGAIRRHHLRQSEQRPTILEVEPPESLQVLLSLDGQNFSWAMRAHPRRVTG